MAESFPHPNTNRRPHTRVSRPICHSPSHGTTIAQQLEETVLSSLRAGGPPAHARTRQVFPTHNAGAGPATPRTTNNNERPYGVRSSRRRSTADGRRRPIFHDRRRLRLAFGPAFERRCSRLVYLKRDLLGPLVCQKGEPLLSFRRRRAGTGRRTAPTASDSRSVCGDGAVGMLSRRKLAGRNIGASVFHRVIGELKSTWSWVAFELYRTQRCTNRRTYAHTYTHTRIRAPTHPPTLAPSDICIRTWKTRKS